MLVRAIFSIFFFFLQASTAFAISKSLLPPNVFVNGSVNVITGQFSDSETDFSPIGMEAMPFQRFYSGEQANAMCSLGYGWDNSFCHSTYSDDEDSPWTIYDGPGSCVSTYGEGAANPACMTNCGSGEISARTNKKNVTFSRYNHNKSANVFLGSGEIKNSKLQFRYFSWVKVKFFIII